MRLFGALYLFVTALAPVMSRAAPSSTALPPQRPLPTVCQRSLPTTAVYFVDGQQGDDSAAGTRDQPWRTVNRALRNRAPGDTVCLRGGVYYENVVVPDSGTDGKPITLRSHPGELAIIDGGLPEFLQHPESAWRPLDPSRDEYESTGVYPEFATRPIVSAFPAAGWEPFHGKEDQRPVVLGHFADSMIPLHGYRTRADLRDTSMAWDVGDKFETDEGVYCGPGLWFNRQTMRIHVRLAHTTLPGLGDRAYRGETDPRKVPLCISGPYGRDVLRMNGITDFVAQDLVLRGASGNALVNIRGSDRITLDGLTCYGGAPGLLAKATSHLTLVNCAFRGLAAPWSSRASMKYRGTPSYQLITQRNQPQNQDWEIASCEFTDDHDGLWLRYVKNLKFHHNLVDHFNDDGVEVGARKRDQELYIYQNLISRCQLTFTLHQMEADESPPDVDEGSGVYITRNVIDLRHGIYGSPPREDGPDATMQVRPAALCGDHGSPNWPNYFFYHNTVLRHEPAWRGYYGFGMGGRGLARTQRRVLNNIFVQIQGIPGLNVSQESDVLLDGNLHWGTLDGPSYDGDFFQQRRSFAFRKKPFPESWIKHDLFADPQFVRFTNDPKASFDVSLRGESPAIDAGVALPDEWFDPLRSADVGRPDLGARPLRSPAWNVGVRGRVPVFGIAD